MTAILEPQDTVPAPALAAAPAPAVVAPAPVVVAPAPVVVAPAPVVVAPAPVVGASPVAVAEVVEPRTSRLTALLHRRLGVGLVGLALLAMIVAIDLLEPAADGPQPVYPGWLEALYTAQTIALFAGAAGFLMGRRWAFKAAVVFSGIGAFNVAMCPASGHHVVGGWWFGEVALAAAMLALPALALWRTRPGR